MDENRKRALQNCLQTLELCLTIFRDERESDNRLGSAIENCERALVKINKRLEQDKDTGVADTVFDLSLISLIKDLYPGEVMLIESTIPIIIQNW